MIRARLARVFMVGGLIAGIASVPVALDAPDLHDYALRVRRARATLRALEVRQSEIGRKQWEPLGTFDIVAGDHVGVAESTLVPSRFWRGKGRRRRYYWMSQAEAASFLKEWDVGRTYDAYWTPDNPQGVFFEKVDPGASARLVTELRIGAGLLIAGGLLLSLRRGKTHPA